MNCNLKCRMCPWESMRPPDSDMGWKTFEAVSRYFREVEEVDLTGGGESLLHSRLEEMVRMAKSAGCITGFSTNATLLDAERARTLWEAGLDWIAYSVDGATPATYEKIRVGASFEKVMKNIEAVRQFKEEKGDRRPKTILIFVMMKENVHELTAMVKLAKSRGIDQVVAKNLDVILTEDDEERRIFKNQGEGAVDPYIAGAVADARKKAWDLKLPFRVYDLLPIERPICEQNPLNTMFIAWDGSVSPCISLSYIKDRCFAGRWERFPPVRFGNIGVESLEAIWEKPEYQNFRKLFWDRSKGRSGDLSRALLPDLSPYQERRCLPDPPQGCGVCYYLYGV
jgi:MoaA/NifB/PqqE/SkfB family radical SAM enzyme